jgi:hypothetical protein
MSQSSPFATQGLRDAIVAKVHRNADAVASSPYCLHCGLQWSDRRVFCTDDCRARFHLSWARRLREI